MGKTAARLLSGRATATRVTVDVKAYARVLQLRVRMYVWRAGGRLLARVVDAFQATSARRVSAACSPCGVRCHSLRDPGLRERLATSLRLANVESSREIWEP
jgi:hypothetical protein